MDDDKRNKRKEFPKEFEYLDEIISKPIQQIHALEKKLTELPDKPVEKSHYEYNPAGYFRAKTLAATALSKDQIERYIDTLDKDVTDLFEVQIKGLDADDANKLREIFQDRRNPNKFENMDEKQLADAGKMEKDVNHSQDYMLKKRMDFRDRIASRPVVPQPEVKKNLTPAELLNRSFSTNKPPNPPEKKIENPKDIDDPEIT